MDVVKEEMKLVDVKGPGGNIDQWTSKYNPYGRVPAVLRQPLNPNQLFI